MNRIAVLIVLALLVGCGAQPPEKAGKWPGILTPGGADALRVKLAGMQYDIWRLDRQWQEQTPEAEVERLEAAIMDLRVQVAQLRIELARERKARLSHQLWQHD